MRELERLEHGGQLDGAGVADPVAGEVEDEEGAVEAQGGGQVRGAGVRQVVAGQVERDEPAVLLGGAAQRLAEVARTHRRDAAVAQ